METKIVQAMKEIRLERKQTSKYVVQAVSLLKECGTIIYRAII